MSIKVIDYQKYPFPKRIRKHTAPNFYHRFYTGMPNSEVYPPLLSSVDWNIVFTNGKQPDCLDIGCGMGRYLIDFAIANGQYNILGLEVKNACVDYINDILDKENITNASAFFYSVANDLPFIEDNSIKDIFYFFADPWFKKRQQKRRAFNQEFLAECHRVLSQDGIMYIQSDVPELMDFHLAELNQFNKFYIEEITDDSKWNLPKTDQELFCIKKSIPYTRIICTKKA